MAGHYGVALYVEAQSGHVDTKVPQPPVAAVPISVTSSAPVAYSVVNTISDVEYSVPAAERRPLALKRST